MSPAIPARRLQPPSSTSPRRRRRPGSDDRHVLRRQRRGRRPHHQRQHADPDRRRAANSTVKVFDGSTQIGTANANANGAMDLHDAARWPMAATRLRHRDGLCSRTSTASTPLLSQRSTRMPRRRRRTDDRGDSTLESDPDDRGPERGLRKRTAPSRCSTVRRRSVPRPQTAAGPGVSIPAILTSVSHSFTSTAVDVAGNTGTASTSANVGVTAPPPATDAAHGACDSAAHRRQRSQRPAETPPLTAALGTTKSASISS